MSVLRGKRRLYYVKAAATTTGPYTLGQLQEIKITPLTLIRIKGSEDWVRARNIKELMPFIQSGNKRTRYVQMLRADEMLTPVKGQTRKVSLGVSKQDQLYYIKLATEKVGPLTVKEIGRKYVVVSDTPIMFKGTRTWIKANDIPEIKPLIAKPVKSPEEKSRPVGPGTRTVKGHKKDT